MSLFNDSDENLRPMTVSISSQPMNVRPVFFNQHKYGVNLLVDVAHIEEMPAFAKTIEPYHLNFYDITLITSGKGSFWLDDQEYELKPNQVLFSTPGQVRRWYVEGLQGICLFFPAEFLLSYFNNPLLLHQFRYFHTTSSPMDMVLDEQQVELLHSRLTVMQEEIAILQTDSDTLLRCIAHEIMICLNRWYAQCHGKTKEGTLSPTIINFRQLLESHFFKYHNVSHYAALLAVTPGHLNVLCKTNLGRTASELITDRIYLEAKRKLIHSTIDIDSLGEALGFSNTSYFCRAFKKHCGYSPLQYRKSTQT